METNNIPKVTKYLDLLGQEFDDIFDVVEELEKDMTPILLEELGMRYPTEKSKRTYRYGLYQCQYCGKEWETLIQNIKSGSAKNCGCQSRKYKNPHGLYKHRLYPIWRAMKQRCYSVHCKGYKDYGARGIEVCARWLDINNFIEDMYPSWEEGLTLDRIDVNGNYEPDNCRWTTRNTQMQNTREVYINNTSGYRGVCFHTQTGKWIAKIAVKNKREYLGIFPTALDAAKAYETYVRLNNLEHNFTSVLTEEEVLNLVIKDKN